MGFNMKKIFLLILLLIASVFLVSCDSSVISIKDCFFTNDSDLQLDSITSVECCFGPSGVNVSTAEYSVSTDSDDVKRIWKMINKNRANNVFATSLNGGTCFAFKINTNEKTYEFGLYNFQMQIINGVPTLKCTKFGRVYG